MRIVHAVGRYVREDMKHLQYLMSWLHADEFNFIYTAYINKQTNWHRGLFIGAIIQSSCTSDDRGDEQLYIRKHDTATNRRFLMKFNDFNLLRGRLKS